MSNKIIYVNFKTKQVSQQKMYNLSKRETQLQKIGITLDLLKKQVLAMDTSKEFDTYVYKVANSIILAFKKLHFSK